MAKLTVSATKPLVWPEMDRSDDGVEGDLRRRRFGRGRCGGLGRCERSGLGCSMKWTAAELLDTVRRRGVVGGRGYGEGVAAMASAMAGACEGEELERRGGVWGVRGREGGRFTALARRRRRRGGEQLRGELRCRRRAPWLPAWQAKQLAGAVAGLGRPGGLAGGPAVAPGKFFPFFSVSVLLNIYLQLC